MSYLTCGVTGTVSVNAFVCVDSSELANSLVAKLSFARSERRVLLFQISTTNSIHSSGIPSLRIFPRRSIMLSRSPLTQSDHCFRPSDSRSTDAPMAYEITCSFQGGGAFAIAAHTACCAARTWFGYRPLQRSRSTSKNDFRELRT